VINKIDALLEEDIAEKRAALEAATGGAVMAMSGVSKQGVTEVLRTLRAQIAEDKLRHAIEEAREEEDPEWRP
jgi:GTP-binding protein